MSESKTQERDVKSFWNSRAGLAEAAGSNDLIAKRLEMDAIGRYVRNGMRLLDVGCGNGITAIDLASRHDIELVGFDFAEAMVAAARERAAAMPLKGRVEFLVADTRDLPTSLGRFDLAYTERVIINLPDWPTQEEAIRRITERLVNGGAYVMCENSQDGLDQVNTLREACGLPAILPPWHNRYLRDAEVERCAIPDVRLEAVEHFTSTYAFLSRVVNAWLAAREGREPSYDAPVNQLALKLPPIGELGQTRLWVWRRGVAASARS